MNNTARQFLQPLKTSCSFVNHPTTKLPLMVPIDLAYDLHLPSKCTYTNHFSNNYKPSTSRISNPILFLPGIFGFKSTYSRLLQRLSNETYSSVYCVDLRNHGDSPNALPFDYKTMTSDIIQFIKSHKLENVHVMGYSLGAKLALYATLKEPTLFGSVLVFDNAPIATHQSDSLLQTIHNGIMALSDAKISRNDRLWKEKATDLIFSYVPNKGIVRYILQGYTNNKPKENIKDFEMGFCHFKVPVRLLERDIIKMVNSWPHKDSFDGQLTLKYDGPVKVIRAMGSNFITKEGITAYEKYFPNYTMESWRSSHDLFGEMENDCFKVMSRFVKEIRFKDGIKP